MYFKKLAMLGITALSLGTAALTTQTQVAEASPYHKARITRNITVYHWIPGTCFANSRTGASHRLYVGQRVRVVPFYHMGKDGYFLHLPGHGSTLYYARTNSSNWFRK